jgi:hypothetical protein
VAANLKAWHSIKIPKPGFFYDVDPDKAKFSNSRIIEVD